MAGKSNFGTVVVEMGGAGNGNVRFVPLGRTLRGRWDWRACTEPSALRLAQDWPRDSIPGQYIELRPDDGTAAIVEPMHFPENGAFRLKVERSGRSLPPPREEFRGVHFATWTFWLRRLIESGAARIVSGRLPENIGEPMLPKAYQPPPPEGASLLAENATLRDQLAAMRAEMAELRALLTK